MIVREDTLASQLNAGSDDNFAIGGGVSVRVATGRAGSSSSPVVGSFWPMPTAPLFGNAPLLGAAAAPALFAPASSVAKWDMFETAAVGRVAAAAVVLPKVSIADLSVTEGAGNAVLRLTLDKAATSPVTVQVATQAGSAGAADFTAIARTVSFAAGSKTATVNVPILNDTKAENAELFRVKLSAPQGATLADSVAVVTIAASDQPTVPGIKIQTRPTVTEGDPGGVAGDGWLSTRGSDIVDSAGDVVRLTGVNWFGGETVRKGPDGLFTRNYRDMMDQMKDLGFNTIRLPFSNDALRPGSTPTDINTSLNPDLAGKSSLQVIDAIVNYAGDIGLKIILDNHRNTAGNGPSGNGLWYGERGYTEAQWIADWRMLAARYQDDPTVVGFDLINEPHNGTWGTGGANDWRLAAERAIDAIHDINPEVLAIVEGIGGDTWWGGNLKGVASAPVRLAETDKLVYSPHEYGNSIFPQRWFSDPNFPNNMPAVWDSYWGYIAKNDIAPVLIGEFGTKLEDPKDVAWINKLMPYIVENGLSFTFWSWNPNSGDTGGILKDDWRTVDRNKLSLLEPALGTQFGESGGTGNVSTDVAITVTLTKAAAGTVSVAWATANVTARAGQDYVAGNGTLTFAPGETSKTITVAVLADEIAEGNETFRVQLRDPQGGTLTSGSTVVTLTDDDSAALALFAATADGPVMRAPTADDLFLA